MIKKYIKFQVNYPTYKPNYFVKKFDKFLSKIIEYKSDMSEYWLLEITFETDDITYVSREIGLDINYQVIFVAPSSENYGNWLDTNMGLENFKNAFDIEFITQEEFEKYWNFKF